ncbi:MAG: RluA family pseudouridine synthase [Sandaracinus sp.]
MARPAIEAPRVLHRDDDFLVIDKPSGLATTSPDGGDCLATRVRALDPRAERCHPSSRLDVEVTGLVIFARTSRGIDAVLRAREEGRYARRYVALARGLTDADARGTTDHAEWRWEIAIDPRDPRKRRALEPGQRGDRAQHAHTRARVLSRSGLTLCLCLEPITGRTHQLRVHAARAGVPLLGDVAYGGARRITAIDGEVVLCPRVALHCLAVVLPDVRGELRTFVSPLAVDLAALAAAASLAPVDASAIAEQARASLSS